jgi:hypothetical protein
MTLIIRHNALPRLMANAAESSFPEASWEHWFKYQTKDSVKLTSVDVCRIPYGCTTALHELAFNTFADILGNDVFPDLSFYGGGLHSIPPEGFLNRHLDSQIHPTKPWLRRYSVVWYGNRSWTAEQGGVFSIETKEGLRSISPQFNTAVCFECTDTSWHSVSKVIGTDRRNTLAVFFWEKERTERDSTMRTSALFSST